jgi:polyisoprenoid-binding protein YceI
MSLMKYIGLFLIVSIYSSSLHAQAKFSVEKGEIDFVSNAELELIKAHSNAARGLVDVSTNQFAFSVDIKTFQGFNGALQREHFMENYMEIDKYPKAEFSGKIIEQIDFSTDGIHEVRAKGDLNIHGQKQTRIIRVKLIVKSGRINVASNFVVPLSDHNISIPKIVNQKIATEIEVSFKAIMIPQ